MSLVNVKVCVKFAVETQFHANVSIHCSENQTLSQIQTMIENDIDCFDNRDYTWDVENKINIPNLFKYRHTSLHNLFLLYLNDCQTLNLILRKTPKTAVKYRQFRNVSEKYQSVFKDLKEYLHNAISYNHLSIQNQNQLNQVLQNVTHCSCGICNYYAFRAKQEKTVRFKNFNSSQMWLNWGWMYGQNEQERRGMMVTVMQSSAYQNILVGSGLAQTIWNFEGYPCCYKVFTQGYGLSVDYIPNLFQRIKSKLKENTWNTINLELTKKRFDIFIKPSPKRDLCDKFWLRWLSLMGEWSPDFERVVLPIQRKMDLFEIDFAHYAFNEGWNLWINPISYSYFVLCLCRISRNINIRWKDKRRFTQCRVCGDIVDCLLGAETEVEKEHAHYLKSAHLEEIRNIRYYVLSKEIESKQCPWKSAVIIADSMDQSCLNLPNEYRKRKSCTDKDPVFAFKLWLTSVISTFQPCYNFFWRTYQTSKGGSMMITLIVFWLIECVQRLCFGSFWPRKLYVVVDSGSENKSYHFLLFLHVLIWFGIFENIELIYFPVGHTHWKVDQQFSIIRQWITKSVRGLKTVKKLLNYLFYFDKDKIAKMLKSKKLWMDMETNDCNYSNKNKNNNNQSNNKTNQTNENESNQNNINQNKNQNYVQWLQKVYDWENIVKMITRDHPECLQLEKIMNPGIMSYNNFLIGKVWNNAQNLWCVRTDCFKHSINKNDWEMLKKNETLWFLTNKISKIKSKYLKNVKNERLLYLHQVMCHKIKEPTNCVTCYTKWPPLSYLEGLSATPMEPLKPINYAKVEEYLHNFNLDDLQKHEWEQQLKQCKQIENEGCQECMQIQKKIKLSLKEAKYKNNSDSAPTLKKKYEKELNDHLQTVNWHCLKNDSVRKIDKKYHIFRNLRVIKSKIQSHMAIQVTNAKQDDKDMHINLFQKYDKFKVSETDQLCINNSILQKCCMFSGSFAKILDALELREEFTKTTKINIEKDYRLASQAVKEQFVSALSKPVEQVKYESLQTGFWQSELNDFIDVDNSFIFTHVCDINWKHEKPHQILVLKNNLCYPFNKQPWLLFYVVDHAWDANIKKRLILGQWLEPVENYSLNAIWTFQKVNHQNDESLKQIHDYNHKLFKNMCEIVPNHNGLRSIYQSIFMDCLTNYKTEDNNHFLLFYRPLKHISDFHINKEHYITIKQEYISEFSGIMYKQIQSIMIDELLLFKKDDETNNKINKHNCDVNFRKLFCNCNGPQTMCFGVNED